MVVYERQSDKTLAGKGKSKSRSILSGGSIPAELLKSSNCEVDASIAAVLLKDIVVVRIRASNVPQTLVQRPPCLPFEIEYWEERSSLVDRDVTISVVTSKIDVNKELSFS